MNKIFHVAVQGPSLSLLSAEPFRAAMEFMWHALAAPNTSTPGDGTLWSIFPGLGADEIGRYIARALSRPRLRCLRLGRGIQYRATG